MEGDEEIEDFLEDDFMQKAQADDGLGVMSHEQISDNKKGNFEIMRRFGLTREHEKFSDESTDDEVDESDYENEDLNIKGIYKIIWRINIWINISCEIFLYSFMCNYTSPLHYTRD